MNQIAYFGNWFQCVKGIRRRHVLGLVVAEAGKENADIRSLCNTEGIPYRTVGSNAEIQDQKEALASMDLLVTGSFGRILAESVFSVPRMGAINVHPGYLPFYRGRHPLPWAIANNEAEAGVAIHNMTREFDMGEILARAKIRGTARPSRKPSSQ